MTVNYGTTWLAVYIFLAISYINSPDEIKPVNRIAKDNDSNIVLRNCQIQACRERLRRKWIILIIFRHFVELELVSEI